MKKRLFLGAAAIDTRRPDKLGTFAGLTKCGRYALLKRGKRVDRIGKQFVQRKYVGAMA